MKKIFIKTTTTFVLIALLNACSLSDFGDMNKNPNSPTNAETAYLLTGALTSSRELLAHVAPTLFIQHFSETQYPGASIYNNFSRYGFFNNLYRVQLFRLKTVIDYNKDATLKEKASVYGPNDAQIAVAEIYSCYLYQVLTDAVGPIPYTQALGGGKYKYTPLFDSQESVYKDIFKRIETAIALIDGLPGSAKRIKGDVLFSGDLTKWKTFANMLRASMAMKVSDVDVALARAEWNKSKAGLVTSNAGNLGFQFQTVSTWENPWFRRFRSREDYAISKPLVDFLKDRQDKRLFVIAEKTKDLDSNTGYAAYTGLAHGLSGENVGSIAKTAYSYPSKVGVRKQDKKLMYYTYAQALFWKAEAVVKGLDSGNAETLYNDAVKASLDQFGVKDESGYYATYLAGAKVKWDATKDIQLIGEQTWIATFLQPQAAYNAWRRLDFPVLTPAPDADNESEQIPVRFTYPEEVETLNNTGYKSAQKLLGGEDKDKDDTKLWWDTK